MTEERMVTTSQIEEALTEAKERLRGSLAWPRLRCQSCSGLGLVGAGAVLTPVGDGAMNAEDYGDNICPACFGRGISPPVLLAHRDCGPLCRDCGDERDTSIDRVRLGIER